MRLITLDKVKPEMELAKTIYDKKNNPLLREGCSNLHRYKKRLKRMGIHRIYVKDKYSEDIEIKDVTTEQRRVEAEESVKKTITQLKNTNKVDISNINNQIDNIIDDIIDNKGVVINLSNVKSKDSYTFCHLVNTTILAIKLGLQMNYNKKKLKNLALGTMLHDIGKIKIPDNILKKKGKLTYEEYEEMKSHPVKGYNLIKDKFEIPEVSKYVVLHHHEKINGNGYPKGKEGKDLHEFAKIACVVDVFDALTSNRHYRQPWTNKDALDLIMSKTNIEFDHKIVSKFMNTVSMHPTGTEVTLNDGRIALIKDQNKGFPNRPIIKIIKDKNGDDLKKPKTINLLEKLDITIIN